MTNDEKRQRFCSGCREDFYNGHNDLGVTECWNLASAKVTRVAFVHLEAVPPWHAPVVEQLSCHRRPQYVRIDPKHPQLVSARRAERERAK